ncbi:N-acetyllactosaminide beta-1,6-N-acetylglucosaminyl-transferase-like [Glandiceps talaboti]
MGIARITRIIPFLIVMATVSLLIQLMFVVKHSSKKTPIDEQEELGVRNYDIAADLKNIAKNEMAETSKKVGNQPLLPSPKHGKWDGDNNGKLWKLQGVTEGNICPALIAGTESAVVQTRKMLNQTEIENLQPVSDEMITRWTFDCAKYKEKREYILHPLSEDEKSYPIAYSIVVHQDAAQVERLFQNIYMPQNVYCIHVDLKSTDDFKQAMVNLVSCFENAFIASKLEHVIYGSISRLRADLNCMEDLMESEIQWKYLINLSGQDFPLKTNREIVMQMKAYKGINDITGVLPSPDVKERTLFIHEVTSDGAVVKTEKVKPPPPHSITIYFGNAYNVFSKEYISWVLHDPIPRDFLEWSEDTYSPDEHYWVSLQRIPGVPGGYSKPTWGFTARAIKWLFYEGKIYPSCAGKYVREVCVFGVGDLHWLTQQHHLFANKFDVTFDPIAVQCLEEWLRYRLHKLVNWTNFPHNLYGGDRD